MKYNDEIYIKTYIKKKLPVFSLLYMIISDTSHLGNHDLEILGMRESVSSRREKCILHTRTISQSFPIVANAPARERFRSRSAIEQWILQKLRANRPYGRARGPATNIVRAGGGGFELFAG